MALWPGQRADRSAARRREARAGLLFVLPWLLSLLIFTTYPVLAVFYLSLTDYNVVQPPTWVGLQNYRTMLSADPAFWISVKITAS
jgi:multiple sugar transport system permease protein